MKVAYAEEQRQHAINPLRPSYQKKKGQKLFSSWPFLAQSFVLFVYENDARMYWPVNTYHAYQFDIGSIGRATDKGVI